MVGFTWSKLVEYFHDRHKEYHYKLSEGKKLSKYAFDTWDENKCKSEKHYLRAFSNEQMIYQIVTSFNMCSTRGGNHSYEVRLQERICSCGKWQNIGIPCSHAIRVCDYLNIDSTTYIHPCYGLENALNTYQHAFVVPTSQSLRNKDREPGWRREDADLIEIQPKQTYGLYHASGHSRRKCPQSRGASTSGHVPH